MLTWQRCRHGLSCGTNESTHFLRDKLLWHDAPYACPIKLHVNGMKLPNVVMLNVFCGFCIITSHIDLDYTKGQYIILYTFPSSFNGC